MSLRPDVAILLDHFGSGGVERVACHLANCLQRRGFRVEIIVLEDEGPIRPLLNEAVVVHRLGAVASARRRRRMKAAVPALAAYLRRHSPRLLHIPGNHLVRPAALAIALANYRGAFIPKITNPVLAERMSRWRHWRRRIFYAWALKKARLVLALSPASVGEILAVDARLAARIRVVHNPYVSDEMIARAGDRRPLAPPIILSIGRLSRQKNHALLLRAAARLGRRPWRLRICGAGPEEGGLQALAEELGIADRVEFPGFDTDPLPEYLAATVMALSSRWEGLPATALEAIACGCPVVSTASSPALVELLRQAGAREPVALDDEAGLAEALREALDGRLPAASVQAILPFRIESACNEHAELFSAVLEAEPIAPGRGDIRGPAGPSG